MTINNPEKKILRNYTPEFILDDLVDGCDCCAWNLEEDTE
jgi:hypothetical protein